MSQASSVDSPKYLETSPSSKCDSNLSFVNTSASPAKASDIGEINLESDSPKLELKSSSPKVVSTRNQEIKIDD
jgi:hypothetical protein